MKRTLILVTISLFLWSTASSFQGGGGESTKAKPAAKKNTPANKSKSPKPPTATPSSAGRASAKPSKKTPSGNTNLVIQVNEPESEIFLAHGKGNALGTNGFVVTAADGSPYSLDRLRAGTYKLTVKKIGFLDFSRQVTVTGKPVKIEVRLEPAIAYLTISCVNVRDALIDVDGIAQFTVGVSRHPVKPGTYRVTVSRKGYIASTQSINLAAPGSESNVIVNLRPIPIASMLAEAETAMAGDDLDRTISICREILTTEPNNRRGNLLLGMSLFEKASAEAAVHLVNAIRVGETVSLAVHVYNDGGVKQILDAKLVLDRNYLRIDVPGNPTLNFMIFKPDFKGVQRNVDNQNISYVTYQGRGGTDGKKSDRTVTIYSRSTFFKGKDTFCQINNVNITRCEPDSANLLALISGWQTELR